MIIQDFVQIILAPVVSAYYTKKGYIGEINKPILVKVSDIPLKSKIYVECECDICHKKYNQRLNRDTNVCGSCNLKKPRNRKKTSNNLTPTKEILLNDLKTMIPSEIAKKYNKSLGTVNRWFKKENINIRSYYGKRYFKTESEEEKAIADINGLRSSNPNISIQEISRILNIPVTVINHMRKKSKIVILSKFDIWEIEYNRILANISFYKKENQSKTLKTISQENKISIETLKRVFKETETPVQLHSFNKSKGELEIKNFINSISPDIKCFSAMFDKKYEIDCFIKSKNFGVEYCGEYWHSVNRGVDKKYHQNKLYFCQEKNIILLTIFESEWKYKQDIIKSMIISRLGLSKKIFARKCGVCEISNQTAKEFHLKNHINGFVNSSINIGLSYNGELVSVLSLMRSRFDKSFQYEISRFSSILGHNVVGGLGKLFSYFIKKYNPDSCVTYSDLRFGEGRSYEKVGFKYLTRTPPNYYYFKIGGYELESRFKYQKSKIKDFKGYSPLKSEYEIMKDNYYLKIYDCGNNKYIWNKPIKS